MRHHVGGCSTQCLDVVLVAAQVLSTPSVVPMPVPEGQRDLRLLVYNIYYQNPDLDQVVATVQQYNPDIVFLMEYSEAIQQQIEPAFAAYPYRLIRPSRFTMGLALFSRVPIAAADVHRNQDTRIPIYDVRFQLGERIFGFVGGHPWPPQPQWGELHRHQTAAIAAVAARAPQPLVVAGDFNAAPWSAVMRDLSAQGQVRVVRRNAEIAKTWQPLPFIGLPLDQVLVSREWQVLAHEHGAPGGSDHTPIVVDLRLP